MEVRSLKALLTWCVANAWRQRFDLAGLQASTGSAGMRTPRIEAYGCEYSAPRSMPIRPQTR